MEQRCAAWFNTSDDYNNDGSANSIKQHTHTTMFVSIALFMLLLCNIQGGFCDGTLACALRVFSMPFVPTLLILFPLLLMLFNELPPPPVVVASPPPLFEAPLPPPPPPLLAPSPPDVDPLFVAFSV